MDINAYAAEYAVQKDHWWFVGRRRFFAKVIKGLDLQKDALILDVGVSTGTNLRMLNDLGFYNFHGLDFSDEAIVYCAKNGFNCISKGDICDMPTDSCSQDLVLATDIIEHITDDMAAIKEIFRVLKPGGHVLITVPAFQSLWGPQDEIAHHKRRYLKKPLLTKFKDVGFNVVKCYYFNYLLFMPILFTRKILNVISKHPQSENNINTSSINSVLLKIFKFDIATAPIIRPPFGVSIYLLAEKGGT